ncbi:hypothetical protein NA56DRAFT_662101 [Hyaloscypha hepaticicola]|uniref:Glutaredoxin-like protein n=1 Tax=Hyaloscypha hepaticicola TaxID=2082293 RepID=A0A2J6PTU3_9HELO|nr:hypothetical protein NA56DRAFT_662101 [Hyaloscypha hepaticicola]
MRPSVRLLQHSCRITLFTRANCSLCTKAKQTLSTVWDVRPFEFKEIDIMKPEETKWRDLYEFDTPVIHINSSKKGEELPELASKVKKLMHRFSPEEVEAKMDAVENKDA